MNVLLNNKSTLEPSIVIRCLYSENPSLNHAPLGNIVWFLKAKKISGHEFAWVIEAVGKEVKKFRKGDHVF